MATLHSGRCAGCEMGLAPGVGHDRYATLIEKPELDIVEFNQDQAKTIADQLATMSQETWQNLLAHPVGVLALLANS